MPDNIKVQIAKDVIKQLKYLTLTHTGYLIDGTVNEHDEEGDSPFNTAVYSNDLKALIPTCEVCALGACYLSSLSILGGEIYPERADNVASEIFGAKNSSWIEAAYEGFYRSDCPGLRKSYYEKYPDDYNRLRVIMENVIANDGEFKPEVS